MIWTLDDTDLRHAPGNWIEMTDLTYNNPELKGTEWYGQPVRFKDDKGNILVNDTIRDWVGWPHYKTNVADQKDNGGAVVGPTGIFSVLPKRICYVLRHTFGRGMQPASRKLPMT